MSAQSKKEHQFKVGIDANYVVMDNLLYKNYIDFSPNFGYVYSITNAKNLKFETGLLYIAYKGKYKRLHQDQRPPFNSYEIFIHNNFSTLAVPLLFGYQKNKFSSTLGPAIAFPLRETYPHSVNSYDSEVSLFPYNFPVVSLILNMNYHFSIKKHKMCIELQSSLFPGLDKYETKLNTLYLNTGIGLKYNFLNK
jgi:hypothetical protein